MRSFFRLLLTWPKAALSFLFLLAILGWHTFQRLPVDVFPDISIPRIVIQSEAGGLSADEVERLVTIPIESAVNGIAGISALRSSSGGGLSFVWVDFEDNVDLTRARFEVFERLARITSLLPEEVETEIAPIVSVTGEIMIVALTADPAVTSDLQLREIAEFDLRTRLLAIPGIGEVTVMGGQMPECRIEVNPAKLATYNLDTNDILEAAGNAFTFASAGYLANVSGDEIPLRQAATLYDTNALKEALIPAAAPLTLGAATNVTLAGAPRRGSASFGGKDAVLLSIQKTPGGNTLELTHAVEAVLSSFEKEMKDAHITLHRDAYRQADLINASIQGSQSLLYDAILIVIAVLGLTLLNVRTILIVLITMPLSVLLGVLFFPLFGIGVNVMTLGGFAVVAGDIVDAAIIFTEVIWRRLRETNDKATILSTITHATFSVLPGVLSSTLTIILVFTPLLLLSGIERRFFQPFGLAYLVIFIASFIVSFIAVPTLSRLLWKAPKKEANVMRNQEPIASRLMKAAYKPIVRLAIRFPLLTVMLALLLFIYTLSLAKGFGSSFLPPFREDAFNAALSLPPGASLEETECISEGCAQAMAQLPGVLTVTRRTGRAERDQHAEPVSSSEFVVRTDLFSDTTALRQQLREILSSVPGATAQVGYPIAHRISAILSGTEAELTISLYAEDITLLRELVSRLQPVLQTMPGLADIQANREITIQTLRIDYDLAALAEAGLTLKSAGEQVATAFNGTEVGEMRDGLRRRPIVIRLEAPLEGLDASAVKNLLLHAPNGKYVKLQDVARVVPEEASNLLLRENGRRRALISCNLAPGANVGDIVKEMKVKLNPIAEAMGCSIDYGGSHRARENAAQQLISFSILLLLALFLLLLFTLGNATMAFVALICIPLGLMGGIIAVDNTSRILSVSSLIGFVTVAGFTLRNGILLISCYQARRAEGAPIKEAIIEGSVERMVPILMTSLTTVLGLIPIMIADQTPGGELLAPLAMVQFGGILGAIGLGLIILPAVAALVYRKEMKKPALLSLLLFCTLPFLPGCKTYSPAPIDWEAELETWHHTPQPLHISSCQEAALLAVIGNLELNQQRATLLDNEKVAAEVGWWEDPSLDLDLKRLLAGGENPFMAGMALSFTIPLSGAPALDARAAQEALSADHLQIKTAEQAIATEARIAYHQLAALLQQRHLIESHLQDPIYQRMRQTLERLVAMGELPPTTAIDLQQSHLDRLNEQKALEHALTETHATLRRLLGLAPWVQLTLTSALDDSHRLCPHCTDSLPSAEDFFLHPSVQEQCLRLNAQETTLQAEIQRQYPDLKLGPLYEYEDGENILGFALGLDLPLWNRNRLAIAQAEADRNATRLSALQTWRALLIEGHNLKAQLDSARKNSPLPTTFDLNHLHTLLEQGEIGIDEYFTFYDRLFEGRRALLETQATIDRLRAELTRFLIVKE